MISHRTVLTILGKEQKLMENRDLGFQEGVNPQCFPQIVLKGRQRSFT